MKLRQECRCGSVVDIEDDDPPRVERMVADWRGAHRCMPVDERDLRKEGVGFAATQTAAPLGQPKGHIDLEVRA